MLLDIIEVNLNAWALKLSRFIPAPALTLSVTWGKIVNFSGTQFPHLKIGKNKSCFKDIRSKALRIVSCWI